jgi:hypothetical protein
MLVESQLDFLSVLVIPNCCEMMRGYTVEFTKNAALERPLLQAFKELLRHFVR